MIDALIQANPTHAALIREAFTLGQQTPPAGTSAFAWERRARFWVSGEPVGQPRPKGRVTPMNPRNFRPIQSWQQFCSMVHSITTVQIYTPDLKSKDGRRRLTEWRTAIEAAATRYRPPAPLNCAVRVDVDLYFPRPQSLMRAKDPEGLVFKTTMPDRDNSDKPVLDVMTECGWWTNDARVCDGPVRKLYHAKDGKPGALITVYVLRDEQQDLFAEQD